MLASGCARRPRDHIPDAISIGLNGPLHAKKRATPGGAAKSLGRKRPKGQEPFVLLLQCTQVTISVPDEIVCYAKADDSYLADIGDRHQLTNSPFIGV